MVKFENTGYETKACATHIRAGSVKDKLARTVLGIGYLGNGEYKASLNGKQTQAHSHWYAMLARCYSERLLKIKPCYRDCTVAEEWHNFQNFAEWFYKNYIENYHLDKDIKVEGNRVYSPETCLFVSAKENSIKSSAKHFKFISPEGVLTEIYNLKEFCYKNDLVYSSMKSLGKKGGTSSYKGWMTCED